MIDDSTSFGHTCVHFNLLWLMLGMLHSDMILNLARACKGSLSLQKLVTCVNASPEACSCLVMANQPRQPAQLAPIKMFLYCLTSLSSQRGRKNSRCCMVFWKESTKNWLTESQFHGSNFMKNWLTESRFSPRCYRSFLFVPNKPEMRAGNYNYPEGCETMKKPFSSGYLVHCALTEDS